MTSVADALTIDGESFATDVRRVRVDRFDGIERVMAGCAGQFVGDGDGNGFVYDGHTVRRVVDRVIDAPAPRVHGFLVDGYRVRRPVVEIRVFGDAWSAICCACSSAPRSTDTP